MDNTADGFEPVWQTNYLGHFLLVSLLFNKLKESSPARIINVSSVMHDWASPKTDFKLAATTAKKSRYGVSKLAQIMFSYEFQRRYANSGVQSIAIHPGGVNTDIWDWLPAQFITKAIAKALLMSPEQAANVALVAGLSLNESTKGKCLYMSPYYPYITTSGSLINNDLLNVMTCRRVGAYVSPSSKLSQKEDLAKKLWEVSEDNIKRPFA
jgi:NAD(P)-dependent dehydrogenase (short-subunit alcohol dehydrogenase family)